MLSLASDDQRLAAIADQWHSDHDVFTGDQTAANLKTGERYPPRREDYCTKCAAVAPGGDCNLWLEFLERVTGGDGELQKYLQRVAGYCLTGHSHEHAIFFLYGTGANGKSVFVNTLAGVWNDYAVIAPAEVFIESHTDRHPTELALLRGARLVVASETQAGRHWNEPRIKLLTGGDKIAARFMRGDFFNFTPQFKLMISGNHKPSLRTVDEAIRRRLHLIPFLVTIPVKERDPDLAEKLKTEWPGILRWAIGGCLDWRRIGLSPPKAVLKATEDYLQTEDDLFSWLQACAGEDPAAQEKCSDLYASWKDWAERTGRRGGAGFQKAFSEALEGKGCLKRRTNKGVVFSGIQLSPR